jgi:hypothetical protein
MDDRSTITEAEATAPEPAPEYAGDESANEGYANPGPATGAAPSPPRVIPDEVSQTQGPAQGGDQGEGGTANNADAEAAADERLTTGYDKATTEQLEAEIEARREEGRTIEVTGTGANGNVTNADRASALEADDAARASS